MLARQPASPEPAISTALTAPTSSQGEFDACTAANTRRRPTVWPIRGASVSLPLRQASITVHTYAASSLDVSTMAHRIGRKSRCPRAPYHEDLLQRAGHTAATAFSLYLSPSSSPPGHAERRPLAASQTAAQQRRSLPGRTKRRAASRQNVTAY